MKQTMLRLSVAALPHGTFRGLGSRRAKAELRPYALIRAPRASAGLFEVSPARESFDPSPSPGVSNPSHALCARIVVTGMRLDPQPEACMSWLCH